MIYVYAAVEDRTATEAALGGADPGGIRLETIAGVSFLVKAPETGSTDDPSVDRLRAHDQVVRAVMDRSTLIPFRFATVVSGADLERWVIGRGQQLAQMFDRFRGRDELALRARIQAEPSDGGREIAGRSYLARLAGQATTPPELAALHRSLVSASAEAVARQDGKGAIKAAYLVARQDSDRFRQILRSEQRRRGPVQVSLTGPWAPYTFASDAGVPAYA